MCRNSFKRLQASPVNDVNDVNADRRWYRLRQRSVDAKFVGSNPAGSWFLLIADLLSLLIVLAVQLDQERRDTFGPIAKLNTTGLL